MRDWLPPPEFSAAGELDTTTDIAWGQRERYFLCANFEAASFAPDAAGRLLGLPQPLIPYEMRPVARGLSDYVQSDAFRSYASSLAGLLLKKGAAALPDAISAFCSFHSSRMGRRDHDERISKQPRITQAVIENYMGSVAVLKLASWSSWHCDSIRQAAGGAFGDVGLHPQLAGGDGSVEPVLLLLHRSQTLVGLHEVRYRHCETPLSCRRCSPYWDAHPTSAVPRIPPVRCSVARYAALAV